MAFATELDGEFSAINIALISLVNAKTPSGTRSTVIHVSHHGYMGFLNAEYQGCRQRSIFLTARLT